MKMSRKTDKKQGTKFTRYKYCCNLCPLHTRFTASTDRYTSILQLECKRECQRICHSNSSQNRSKLTL